VVGFGVRGLKSEVYGSSEPFASWALLLGEYLTLQIVPELVLTMFSVGRSEVGKRLTDLRWRVLWSNV
jgi:hypothetical protein